MNLSIPQTFDELFKNLLTTGVSSCTSSRSEPHLFRLLLDLVIRSSSCSTISSNKLVILFKLSVNSYFFFPSLHSAIVALLQSKDHVIPTIRYARLRHTYYSRHSPQHIILHVGTNDLKTERTDSQIAKYIIDLSISLKKNENMIAVSGIVPRLDELNNKATDVYNRLELLCKQRSLPYISHCQTIDPNKHLNESNLHLNSYSIRVFAENFSNFLFKSNLHQLKVNSETKESSRKKPVLHLSNMHWNRYLIYQDLKHQP